MGIREGAYCLPPVVGTLPRIDLEISAFMSFLCGLIGLDGGSAGMGLNLLRSFCTLPTPALSDSQRSCCCCTGLIGCGFGFGFSGNLSPVFSSGSFIGFCLGGSSADGSDGRGRILNVFSLVCKTTGL